MGDERLAGVIDFNFYLVKIYSAIMAVTLIALCITLRLKMDIGAFLIVLGYTISMIFRISELKDIRWMSTAAELIALVSLFTFLFQMKLIKDKLTSESAKDYQVKLRSTKIQISLIITCYVFFVYGLEFVVKLKHEQGKNDDILIIIRTISKFIADTYCFVAFMQVFRFFINKKMDANNFNSKPKLSPVNKFAVGYTIVQYVLQMIYKSFSIFFWGYFYSSLNSPSTYTANLMNEIIFNAF